MQSADKRDKLDRSAARQHGLCRLFRQQVGGHAAQQAAAGRREALRRSPFTNGFARACTRTSRTISFVREILTATGDARPEPARRLVSRGEGLLGAARRHGAAVFGPANSMRPLPSPSVREVEPAGLLRLRGVLRAGRPQARAGAERGPDFPQGRHGDGPESEDGPEREADAAWARSRWRFRRRTIRGRRWPTGCRARRIRSSAGRWSIAIGSTSSAAAWSIPKTTCG